MKSITLISDWKLKDPYVAMLKGQLISQLPDAYIFDITHSIELLNLHATAFVLKNSFRSFPTGSVHIILTKMTFDAQTVPVLVEFEGHYFLGQNNGIFSLLFANEDYKVWQFDKLTQSFSSFVEKMVQVVSYVFHHQIEDYASPHCDFKHLFQMPPVSFPDQKKIEGHIIYIDSAYNAVTDIPTSMFLEIVGTENFEAKFSRNIKVTKYHESYDFKESEIYLINNRMGFLEITIYDGNIALLADLHSGDAIEIQGE